jgi:hypothetical protein
MSEYYDQVEELDWFSRIGESFRSIGFACLAIIISFIVLIYNEGQTIVNQVAQSAIPISSTVANQQHVGKLISMSGVITSNETLGDGLFIKPGKYIVLGRSIEIYGWRERRNKQTKNKVGGSQTRITTATYDKIWIPLNDFNSEKVSLLGNDTSVVESTKSTSFLQPQNHQNPNPTINDASFKVSSAKIGLFNLDMQSFQLPTSGSFEEAFGKAFTGYVELPTPTFLQLSKQNTTASANLTNTYNYAYQGSGNLDSPNVGDLRMRYATLNSDANVTVIGKLANNNQIVPYVHKNHHRLYRIFLGNQTQASQRIKKEDETFTWAFRFIALLLMWYGFRVIAEPVNIILDFIPLFGSVGRAVSSFSTLIVSLTLTISTIIIYHITYNLLYVAIAIPLLFLMVNVGFRKR